MKRLLKKSPFFVLGLYGAEKGRSCNRLASLVASQPVSPIAVPDEAPVKADKRATTWGERENKLVKPTHWKVILQETPIFSRHRLPGLVHCHSAKTDSLATTREQIGKKGGELGRAPRDPKGRHCMV